MTDKEFLKTTKYLRKFLKKHKIRVDIETNPHTEDHRLYFYFNNKIFLLETSNGELYLKEYKMGQNGKLYARKGINQYYTLESDIIDYISNLLGL